MAKDNFPAIPAFPHPLVKIPAKILSVADRQDGLRNFHGRIALHAERRAAAAEARHASPWWPPTAIAWPSPRSITNSRASTRSAPPGPQESHDGSAAPGRRSRRRRPNRIRAGRKPSLLPRRRPPADLAHAHRPISRITKPCCRATTTRHVVIERGELNDAVRRVSQLADQRSHAVKFPSPKKASKFPRPAPNTAKPRKPSKKNTRASRSPSASTRSTCWIFSPPPPTAPSASN